MRLLGSGSDLEDPVVSLSYHWQVDTHHNNHVHPGTYVSYVQNAYIIGDSHDDGTGSYLRVHLTVTDTDAMKGTASVDVFPEVDLAASPVTVLPESPGTQGPSEFRFWIRNNGRMDAPFSRWVLQANGVEIAAGDTIVPHQDSVQVVRQVESVLGAGTFTLRLALDSLATVVETDICVYGGTSGCAASARPSVQGGRRTGRQA